MMPRYLAPFHPKHSAHWFTDLLVIGGGVAGLRAANEASRDQAVLVVTKDQIQESNSSYAQGGIAGVMDPEDCFADHVADTIRAGGSLCDPTIVEMVVREAPRCIEELLAWGTSFDADGAGLHLGREGGHSHQRIVHALGDATGKEIMRAIIQRTRAQPQITVWERAFTIDLLTYQGACVGAVIARDGQPPMLVWAKQTILAAGGAGQVFRESTNPPVATGDGFAAAYRAGVELRDMEFMQFHPTVLYLAGSARSLITEAIRGEGAHLVDCHGHRFMPHYDPRGELAPRDIVSQSIVRQMVKSQHPCVYLDLSHLDAKAVHERFPGISRTCRQFGLDIASDRIPVRPGAHYMIGGVTVDAMGRTSMPHLWAAGEVTSSGLHGANRLASNSLLEGLVYGRLVGRHASEAAANQPDRFTALPIENPAPAVSCAVLDLQDIRNSLRSLMGRLVGVERNEAGLAEAVQAIDHYCGYVLPQPFDDADGWELQNLLTVGRLMAASALLRRESRGVHFRTDHPTAIDPQWCDHIVVQSTVQQGTPRLAKTTKRQISSVATSAAIS
jgi:L-aspartate oxidase